MTAETEDTPVVAIPLIGAKVRAYSYVVNDYIDAKVLEAYNDGKQIRYKVKALHEVFCGMTWYPVATNIAVAKCINCNYYVMAGTPCWIVVSEEIPANLYDIFHTDCPGLREEKRNFTIDYPKSKDD